MPNYQTNLKFIPFQIENAGRVNSIRLVTNKGQIALAALTDAVDGASPVSVVNIDGSHTGPSRSVCKLQSPFGTPSWDIANTRTGFAAVWTKPGSAISPLGYYLSDSPEVLLTGYYRSGVFQNPRFVRGSSALAVTAVVFEERGNVLAIFEDSLETGHSSYVTLPPLGPNILLDGLLLRHASGYLLFAKLLPSGPRGSEREDRRGESIKPGILRCLRLNMKLQPMGGSMQPLGDTEIFEFDADVSGSSVFLLATTRNGFIAATTNASEEVLDWIASPDIPRHVELVAPAVLASGNTAIAVVIECVTPKQSQILLARSAFNGP